MGAPASAQTSPPLVLVTFFFFFATIVSANVGVQEIAGSREQCQNEGESVAVDSIKDIGCFHCICKNGFVECLQEQCPDVKNCYIPMPKEGCCIKCKGCVYGGAYHNSNTEWSEPNDPCRIFRCEAGVITETTVHCYTPCDHPKPPPPGQCCPSCLGCSINGQKISEGRDATLWEDPCLKCHCSKGKLTCVKQACPVLPCPLAYQNTSTGQCCPVCMEGKLAKHFLPDNKLNKPCILGKDYHNHGNNFVLDRCTTCSCINGTTKCDRQSCPILECAPEHQHIKPGECCPQCPPVEEVRSTCTHNGKTYGENADWMMSDCISCKCRNGEPRCFQKQCPPSICLPGQVKIKDKDDPCCYKCVERDGVCTVFGDPHYKTFDGRFYSFQGSCKYQLVADCANHTFSIRSTNDGRYTKHSSWTKTISLKIGDTKINLGKKLRVKVDGVKVILPHIIEGNVAHIERQEDTVVVNTDLGIKLTWDGTGYLQVSAPTSYKGKLCGLCGNYNSIVRDDLMMRNGDMLKEGEDISKFGNSWRVGGKKACSRKHDKEKEKPCQRNKNKANQRICKYINKSESFASCRLKLSTHNYYEACIMDMCECPTRSCYYDAFSAYGRECERLGGVPGEWKKEFHTSKRHLPTLPSSHSHLLRTHQGASNLITQLSNFPRPPPGKARPPPPILH